MPLNQPGLSLPTDPRAVPRARRWVSDALRSLGRHDLTECAALGTSELVTNAVIHAEDPISVRLRGTRRNPRVEVADGSTRPPAQPSPIPEGVDELLTTFGRGLSIVARCAVAWGTTIEPDGKIVWFEPAVEAGETAAVGVTIGVEVPARPPVDEPLRPLVISGVPVAILQGARRQFRELRRELRLLSLAHAADYPLATQVSDLFEGFDASFPPEALAQVDAAIRRGQTTVDIHAEIAPSAGPVFARMLDLLELADEFCRAQRLLSLARTEDEATFQRWWFGEFAAQAEGRPGTPWRPGSR